MQLPDEEIETGYGVKWQAQSVEYFKELGKRAKFKTRNEWSKDEIFHMEMAKNA